jgi:hypothetical protein
MPFPFPGVAVPISSMEVPREPGAFLFCGNYFLVRLFKICGTALAVSHHTVRGMYMRALISPLRAFTHFCDRRNISVCYVCARKRCANTVGTNVVTRKR